MLRHSLLRSCCALVGCLLLLLVDTTHIFAASDTWDGGGADNNISTDLNWVDNTHPLSDLTNTDLIFAGTVRLAPNFSSAFSAHSVTFNNTAGAFTLGGQPLTIGSGGIVNNDADTQTFSNAVNPGATASFNAASGPLTFNNIVFIAGNSLSLDGTGAFSFKNFGGLGTVTKNGAGTMTWSPTIAQESDFAIGAGTVNTTADGSTDTFNTNSSIAVNGTSIVNFNENTTFDSAPLTRASGATVTVAAGKTLTIQNDADAIITGAFLNNNASTIAVTGAGSTFTTTGTLTVNGGSTMNITSGGAVSSGSGQISVGTASAGGTATVDGSGSSLGGGPLQIGLFGTGSLTFSNSSMGAFGSISVDSSAGTTGTLNIQSGAIVTGTSLSVAHTTSENIDTVTINGTNSALTLTGAGTATVGAVSGSTGTINVQSGGTFNSGTSVTSANVITVNATGTIAITGGTFNANGNMALNGQMTRDGAGTFTLAAGKTLTIQNGGDAIFTGGFANSTASTIVVTGAGSTFTISAGSLTINGGSAMNVTAGGAVSSGTSSVNIGTSGNGTATVDGSGSSFGGSTLVVGLFGNTGSLTFSNSASGAFGSIFLDDDVSSAGTSGTLNIQSGATVSGTGLAVAPRTAANTGTLTITGAGSVLTITSPLTEVIGAATASTGSLNVQSGGTFNSGTGTTTVKATGTVAITGGTFKANGDLTVDGGQLTRDATGAFNLADGRTLTIQNGGEVIFTGTYTTGMTTTNVQSGGTFTSGTGTITLSAGGTINIDGGTVNFTGPLVHSGTVNFNSGALSIIDNWNVGAGGLLGTDVTFDSTRTFTTTATTTVDASHTLTLAGSTFNTGSLVVNGTFTFNSGTLGITGAGGLTVGSGGPLGGSFVLGTGQALHVTNTLTVNSGADLTVHSVAPGGFSAGSLVNNGDLVVINSAVNAPVVNNNAVTVVGSVDFNGPVSGPGNFYGPGTAHFNGGMAPGASPANVSFEGSLALADTNTLFIEIGGIMPGSQYDRLSVAGSATIDGTLALSTIGGFVPTVGDRFTIATFGSRSGTFAGITGQMPAPGVFLSEIYRANDLILLATSPGEKTWGIDASGNASVGGNWIGGVAPGGVGDSATFSTIISAPRVVTLDADTTVGTLKFDSPVSYTIAGPHVLTLQAAGASSATLNILNNHGNGAHTISAPVTVASNLNIAQNSAGTLRLTGPLDDSMSRTITKSGGGTIEIAAQPTLGASTVVNVNSGTFRFATSSGSPTLGAGVQVNVSGTATLELAGSVSALSSGSNRVNVVNNSSAAAGVLVSGTNQQVDGIDGSGTTQVNAGSDLTANHIIQGMLIIGGTAGSPALVTIDASDASGNPLIKSSGLALAGSLTPDDPFGAGGISSSANLSSGGELAAPWPSHSIGGGYSSTVPEPSTLLLVLLAITGLVGQRFARICCAR